ncbi:MAG: sulfur oxidation c-type cytochrome SoxA [Albidovulum sp.]|nr:sulfur oxidation c-type cytochrome SoxA [Albidovulum sp.]
MNSTRLLFIALILAFSESLLARSFAEQQEVGDGDLPISGYFFMGEQVRALQDDDFLNPGMFAVERGYEIWSSAEGGKGQSCESCHGDAAESMRGVAARYPVYDRESAGLVNLEGRINEMRTEYMDASEYPLESDDMLSLSAFVAFQSRGMPMQVDNSGEAQRFWKEGRKFYLERRGQLDLACSQCHDGLAGSRLRGDTISQGHVNGFPFYRLQWRAMGSRHRMFRWCNWAVRAESFELGSPEYLSLELYVAWKGNGLPVEAPAVRP